MPCNLHGEAECVSLAWIQRGDSNNVSHHHAASQASLSLITRVALLLLLLPRLLLRLLLRLLPKLLPLLLRLLRTATCSGF